MIAPRGAQIAAFIATTEWHEAAIIPLAGDASGRKYHRLADPDHGTAILMDAPPPTEDVRPFIAIAGHLRGLGLSAPDILAADMEQGFLLLEDLGDDLFARVLVRDPDLESVLYKAAIDALIVAQDATAPDLATYGPDEMAETACLVIDWYAQHAGRDLDRAEFRNHVRASLNAVFTEPLVLTQRDYHAENLLWLPSRQGVARTGLLDFQDAMLSHPAYDLASLLIDARRDVTDATRAQMISYYATRTNRDPDALTVAVHTLSAQRNLRILGVFTRLCVRDGKRHYPDLMPRVWRNLQTDLRIADMSTDLPEPTPEVIAKIKNA